MKYAVLAASGQLGRDLCPRLPGEVIRLGRPDVDVTQSKQLRAALTDLRPAVVFNCAAYNFVDKAESEPEKAFAVNTLAVRELALICRDLDCVLVHFSSDYVFGLDAQRHAPYSETDLPGPVSVYGTSKLAGEYLLRSLWPKHFLIRTCGLYGVWGSGGKGGNFVETMLRVAGQGKPLRVVADQRCTPSYTVDVALAAVALLQTGRFGLYHVTNAGSCSWFEFASTIFRLAGISAQVTPITSAEFGAAAARPTNSVLACDRLAQPLRPWQEALAAYLEERKRRT